LSASRFRQLKAEGLPVVGKRVDYEKAVAWMQATIDPVRKDNWQNGSLNDLRRERERVKIEQQKLELAKARGELIERKTSTISGSSSGGRFNWIKPRYRLRKTFRTSLNDLELIDSLLGL
jgi:hypothetical protein